MSDSDTPKNVLDALHGVSNKIKEKASRHCYVQVSYRLCLEKKELDGLEKSKIDLPN